MNVIERFIAGGRLAFKSVRVVLANIRLLLFPLLLIVPVIVFAGVLAHAQIIEIFSVRALFNLDALSLHLPAALKMQLSLFVALFFFPFMMVVNIAFAQCSQCALEGEGVHFPQSLRFGLARLFAALPIMLALTGFLFFLALHPTGIIHSILHLLGLILFYFAFPVLADEEIPSWHTLRISAISFMHNALEVVSGSVIFVTLAALGTFILLHFGSVLGMGAAFLFGERSLFTAIAIFSLPVLWLLIIATCSMVFAVDLYRHTWE